MCLCCAALKQISLFTTEIMTLNYEYKYKILIMNYNIIINK